MLLVVLVKQANFEETLKAERHMKCGGCGGYWKYWTPQGASPVVPPGPLVTTATK